MNRRAFLAALVPPKKPHTTKFETRIGGEPWNVETQSYGREYAKGKLLALPLCKHAVSMKCELVLKGTGEVVHQTMSVK